MVKANKDDKYIKKLAQYAGLSYQSAKSLYHLMCTDKRPGAQERLNGCMIGDEFCIAEAKEVYSYYGKLKLTVSVDVDPEAANFEESVRDVSLIIWSFKKIGDKQRIEKAVKMAMSMFEEKKGDKHRPTRQRSQS